MNILLILGAIGIVGGIIYWAIKKDFKKALVVSGTGILLAAVSQPLVISDVALEKMIEKYNNSSQIQLEYQLAGASLKKNKIKNPELDKYKKEPKDEIKIIIGEENGANFIPNIEIRRWNEVGFKIKPRITSNIEDQELEFADNKIKFKTPEMEIEMEDFEEGFKFIWSLNEKPATTTICFDMESEGLDFLYQSELTQQEIDEGAFRPEEDMVGSYAIYHQTKGGMVDSYGKDYKAGKFGHIPRPRLYDSDGREEFAERLLIENDQYCVVMAEDFWSNAVYPIKANDQFGYDTSGSGSQTNNRYLAGSKFTGGAGTVTEMEAYALGGNTSVGKFGIYLHSTLALIADGESNSWSGGSSAGFPTNPTIEAVDYVLATIGAQNGPSTPYFKYDTGVTDQGHTQNSSGWVGEPTIPDPFTTPYTHSTRKYSIWATYTPGNGASIRRSQTVVPQ